ncbi:predicted protein [Nematostella vectensis]|uniref:Protein MAK10 homolog n=1 Tax=Nematostella vectensis TaxID=45351 RepID=A7SYP2_NEMVE|nr:predicted protein [Nematostella vectensis]|eukprot:XP_001623260.1 predicted protein [Nematostella vectensis]
MVHYLVSGFELELYSPHEYHCIYWYLDYLFGWHMNCLTRAEKLLQAQEAAIEQKSGKSGKKNKRKKKGMKLVRILTCFDCFRERSKGCGRLVFAFELEGKMKRPNFEFGSEQANIRFERRFMPFQVVDTPQAMYYAHYRDYTEMSRSSEAKPRELYLLAANAFYQAKSIFEPVVNPTAEVNLLLKVSKTNLVVSKLAAGGHKQGSANAPVFEFGTHQAFPILKIT